MTTIDPADVLHEAVEVGAPALWDHMRTSLNEDDNIAHGWEVPRWEDAPEEERESCSDTVRALLAATESLIRADQDARVWKILQAMAQNGLQRAGLIHACNWLALDRTDLPTLDTGPVGEDDSTLADHVAVVLRAATSDIDECVDDSTDCSHITWSLMKDDVIQYIQGPVTTIAKVAAQATVDYLTHKGSDERTDDA